jgi:hypothetical protein
MWQQLALDRHRRSVYYALVLSGLTALSACARGPQPLGPDRLPAISRATVREWVEEFTPGRALRYDLRWTYQTQRGSARGRAAVQLAPPDSIRFDYRGPFGRSGAAVVIGDSVIWAEPQRDVERLIPVARLFWGALGVAREPPQGAVLVGGVVNGARVWRHVDGGESVTYVVNLDEPRTLRLEMSQWGKVVGTVNVRLEEASVLPRTATMVFPSSASLFVITVAEIERLPSIDPEIWREP